MTGCLEYVGLYPPQQVQSHDNWQPWMMRYDVASRVSLYAICLLSCVGLILMGLGFNQSVHPIAGVAVLCSTLIPIAIICSLRSTTGPKHAAIYK